MRLSENRKSLIIPDENKKEQVFQLESLYDIEKYKEQLTEVLKRYTNIHLSLITIHCNEGQH